MSDKKAALLHYRIVRQIGSGGGGEVYEALDSKLNRSVALKLVPGGKSVLAEARAASALEHPNILTVHDVGEDQGRTFIVTELVRGRTLREVLSKGRLDRDDALSIAVQLARGLGAAHAAGIVHRDVKPDNVMLTDEGVVKILDFGLAQMGELESEAETAEIVDVGAGGAGSGTAGYMSPEQTEGRGADARADVFAFGAILFELLSGSPAFSGETATARSTSVLRDEPVLRGFSEELQKLVGRCLRKDPQRRFQSLADIPMLLEDIRETPGATKRAYPLGMVVVSLSLIVVAAAAAVALWPRTEADAVVITPITSFRGAERDPAISPDGTRIAFVWEGEGWEGQGEEEGVFPGLYVKILDEASVPLKIAPHAHGPTFSPDGQRIAFLAHRDDDLEWHDIRVIPYLGGEARTIGQSFGADHSLSWSSDGQWLALIHRESRTSRETVHLLSFETGDMHPLTKPGTANDGRPRFSPDGSTLAFRRSEGLLDQVFLVDHDGGGLRRIDGAGDHVGTYDWTADGSAIVYGTQGSLFRIAVPDGQPEQLPFRLRAGFEDLAIAGERALYREERDDPDLWRAPGPLSADNAPPARFIHSTQNEYQPAYSPDGSRIAFPSTRSGTLQIWTCLSDASDCRPLSEGPGDKQTPRWSPDGQQIAYSSVEDARRDMYLVSSTGGIPKKLTGGESTGFAFSWSRDGRHLYYMTDRTGETPIWKMNQQTREVCQLTTQGGAFPWESEDGRFVYYKAKGGRSELRRVPAEGGLEQRVTDYTIAGELFALWDGKLFHRDWDELRGNLYVMLDLTTLQTTEVYTIGPDTPGVHYGRMSVSPDGQFIVYSRGEVDNGDIMLAENLFSR